MDALPPSVQVDSACWRYLLYDSAWKVSLMERTSGEEAETRQQRASRRLATGQMGAEAQAHSTTRRQTVTCDAW
jgi:hypothetical protein